MPDRSVDGDFPMFFLSLRATFRQDLKYIPSELVYGETIRLPGDFFPFADYGIHASDFIKSLKQFMTQLRPTQDKVQKQTRFFLPMDLMKCIHVSIRNDAVRAPVRPPYDGPLLVTNTTVLQTPKRRKRCCSVIRQVNACFHSSRKHSNHSDRCPARDFYPKKQNLYSSFQVWTFQKRLLERMFQVCSFLLSRC